jgi:hypothetical protein
VPGSRGKNVNYLNTISGHDPKTVATSLPPLSEDTFKLDKFSIKPVIDLTSIFASIKGSSKL